MAPAFSANNGGKLGDITEIEVSKPDLRLSRELKEKLQSMNQFSPSNRSPNVDAASKLLKMNKSGNQDKMNDSVSP